MCLIEWKNFFLLLKVEEEVNFRKAVGVLQVFSSVDGMITLG